MLLTSSQVSLAISSTIVLIFTTVLFLCGYVVQQNTMNNIREAIKPRPLPDYSKLYNPPEPDASPHEVPLQGDVTQIVESSIQGRPSTYINIDKNENGDQLIQGEDGGFLRKSKGRRPPKQKLLEEETDTFDSFEKTDNSNSNYGMADKEKSTGDAREGPIPDLLESVSRATRRKRIKEEIAKINGPDPKPGANPYRRRRMW